MARSAPNFTPDVTTVSSRRAPLFDLEIAVVTPLFGGGPIAREVDPMRPVSGKSVRGQLRFWWRACRGAGFMTPEALFKAEEAIWGSVETPSAVDIQIETLDGGQQMPLERYGGPFDPLGYALFPFQGNPRQRIEAASPLEGVRFRLIVSCARHADEQRVKADVEAALWAWLLFGGIGARTRRGCGSLYCKEAGFHYESKAFAQAAHRHIAPGQRRLPVPILSGAAIVALSQGRQTPDVWKEVMATYKEFRQQRTGSGGRGRSKWPEPDSLRDYAHTFDPKHKPEHLARPLYPRADLGLPIVFHFKDRDDPKDLTLESLEPTATRMASPLILKSLALTQDTAVSLALMLNAPHIWDADVPKIGFHGERSAVPDEQLRDPTKSRAVGPMQNCVTAREAFLKFALDRWQQRGASEVTL